MDRHQTAVDHVYEAYGDVFKPAPRLSPTEWSDRYRILSREASFRPGRFDSSLAPYQREPMDSVLDPTVERVVLMWASQTGKTETINNIVGFHIDWKPSPILVLQPTLEMAETWIDAEPSDDLTP